MTTHVSMPSRRIPKRGLVPLAFDFLSADLNTRDPEERLLDGQVVESLNVRNDGSRLVVRGGSTQLNSTPLAAASIDGLCEWTRRDGTRYLVVACAGKLHLADPDSWATTVATVADWSGYEDLLDAGEPVFFQAWGNDIYGCNGVQPVFRISPDGVLVFLTALTPPSVAPTVALTNEVIDDFDADITGWTATGAQVTLLYDTAAGRWDAGGGSLRLTFSATAVEGDGGSIDLGAGNELDLSGLDAITFWARASVITGGFRIQIGEASNAEQTFDFSLTTANTGEQFTWDISSVPPAQRNAIRYVKIMATANATAIFNLNVDELIAPGYLVEELDYIWCYTYYSTTTLIESSPSPVSDATRIVKETRAGLLTMARSIEAAQDVDKIRIYRMGGGATAFVRIVEIDNPVSGDATYTDGRADPIFADELVEDKAPPPPCSFLLAHDNRMWYLAGKPISTRQERLDGGAASCDSSVAMPDAPTPGRSAGAEVFITTKPTANDLLLSLQMFTEGDWQAQASRTILNAAIHEGGWLWFPWDTFIAGADLEVTAIADTWRLLMNNADPVTGEIVVPGDGEMAADADGVVAFRHRTEDPAGLYISTWAEPSIVPEVTVENQSGLAGGSRKVGAEDGSALVAAAVIAGEIVFGKETSIWAVSDTKQEIEYFTLRCLRSDVGCGAARSMIAAEGLLFLLGNDQRYWAMKPEGEVREESWYIADQFTALTPAQARLVCATYCDRKLYVGSAAAETVWVLDLSRMGADDKRHPWTKYDTWLWMVACAARGTDDPRDLYFGDNAGTIWQGEVGDTDDGDPISWRWVSKAYSAGPRRMLKQARIYTLLASPSQASVAVGIIVDRGKRERNYPWEIPEGQYPMIESSPDPDLVGEVFQLKLTGTCDAGTELNSAALWTRLVR